MILNKDRYPVIRNLDEGRLEYTDKFSNLFSMRNWDDADYWYCEMFSDNSFEEYPIDTLIEKSILQKIKTDDITFLTISNRLESFHSIVKPLFEELILKNNIPPNKIILISESANIYKTVLKVANELNQEPISVEWSLEFEKITHRSKRKTKVKLLNTLANKSYSKKFLNFNRRWRYHRPTLIALLASKNLLESGYISLGRSDDNFHWSSVEKSIKNLNYRNNNVSMLIDNFYKNFKELPDMYLDSKDLLENKWYVSDDTNYYYENTYFSVVSETNFYNETSVFFTEKIFKPCANLHPFILVSVPNSLEWFRMLGYKTFHPWINEDYDLEENDSNRMEMILQEIERLCNLTEEEFDLFLAKIKPIVFHNYAIIMKSSGRTLKML